MAIEPIGIPLKAREIQNVRRQNAGEVATPCGIKLQGDSGPWRIIYRPIHLHYYRCQAVN